MDYRKRIETISKILTIFSEILLNLVDTIYNFLGANEVNIPKIMIAFDPVERPNETFIIRTTMPIIYAKIHLFDIVDKSEANTCKLKYGKLCSALETEFHRVIIGAEFVQENELSKQELSELITEMVKWYEAFIGL